VIFARPSTSVESSAREANEIATAKKDRDYAALTCVVSGLVSGLIEASWKDERGKI
jgi:hypothetical protein